eukprot:333223_1
MANKYPISNDSIPQKSDYDHYLSICSWIYAMQAFGLGVSMIIGGKLSFHFGIRKTAFLGSALMSAGVALSYYTINHSFITTLITYGMMQGFGLGIAYIPPIVCGMKWFPKKKGTVNGLIVFGFGASAFIFDIVMTVFVNPNNIEQDSDTGFLYEPQVLDNLPVTFLKLALIYSIMQIIGIACLFNAPAGSFQKSSTKTKVRTLSQKLDVADNEEHAKLLNNHNDSTVWRDRRFWNLYFSLLCNGICITYFGSQWKAFINQRLKIENDYSLAMMGAVSAIANGLSRIFWGFMFDIHHNYKHINGIMAAISTVFLFTWPTLSNINDYNMLEACSFIWLASLYFFEAGVMAIYPTFIADLFGVEKSGINYGYLFTAYIPASIFGIFFVVTIRDAFGWVYMSVVVGIIQLFGLILVLMSGKTPKVVQYDNNNEKLRALSYISAG